jgi:phosphate transport system permease protein
VTVLAFPRTPQRGLHRARLPRWVPAAVAGAAVTLATALVVSGRLTGAVPAAVLAALTFLVALTALSLVAEGRRRAKDRFVTVLVYAAFVVAVAPLVSVGVTVVRRGLARFDVTFFTHSLYNIGPLDTGGGVYHALVGTLEQVGLASAVCVPIGLLAAIYVVEYGRGALATAIRFFVDVMTGIPSIVAGLFILAFWVLGLGMGFSGLAASLSLMVLMLPIVIRSCEEMLRLVPGALREGSYALGVPQWKTVLRVVLPSALPGMITGIMLAVARITGETAPVLLTAGGNPAINMNPFAGRQASLSLVVYDQATRSVQSAIDRAWTAALTLILIVLALNLLARLLARRTTLARNLSR